MDKSNNINPLLQEIGEDVMGFLNEVQLDYPEAISFASGRPSEDFFDIGSLSEFFDLYVDSLVVKNKMAREQVLNSLGQYNRTKGIINELMARYLMQDEYVDVSPDSIMLTVGTQEALCIAVFTLCDKLNDVIIVEDPTYIGITHLSILAGYNIDCVPVDDYGMSLELLEEKILRFRTAGKKVKIVYVIPDYQNPTGIIMPIERRYDLLKLASKYDFFILEDNAYGEFTYEGVKPPTLKALDKDKSVVYLRSFSKTIYPSLRLAALVTDRMLEINGVEILLIDLMAKVKGYITVNTSSVNQAIFGGILIKNNYSLKKVNQLKIADLESKLNQLMISLSEYLDPEKFSWARSIHWCRPKGGFFLTIKLPFKVDKDEVIKCAKDYYVIITPMTFFYLKDGGQYEIRLAFSNVSIEEIKVGVERLSQYLKSKLYI